ncbi:MAG: apolipoprotein N-acyltransferase [Polyangiaceae bacterium]
MTFVQKVDGWLAGRPGPRAWQLIVAGSLASGALFALCARMEWAWLLFVAPVPWLFALDRLTRTKHALAAGALLSAVFVALVLPWFPAAVGRYTGAPSALLWVLYLALAPLVEPQIVAFALSRRLLRGDGSALSRARAAVGGAFVWVAVEKACPKLFFDTLGQGFYPSPLLRQAADLAGVHGLTLAALLVAEAILAAAAPAKEPDKASFRGAHLDRYRPLVVALVGVAMWLGHGASRRAALSAPATAHVDIGVVQANITAYEKLRAEKGAFETVAYILDTHVAMSDELLKAHKSDFVVWPETVYPTTFGSPKSEAGETFDRAIEAYSATRRIPLVFGAYDAEDGLEYNATFFLSPRGEERPSRAVYRKHLLFPLTEWVPAALDSPGLRRAFPWLGTWSRGPGARVVPYSLPGREPLRVLPLICYDALSSSLVAEGASSGADVIVTLSNDSWFPDERAPRLHLISAALRSVETGLAQVRATNSGVSAVISPTGDIEGQTPWDAAKTMVARVTVASAAPPPAVRWGPRLGPIAWVVAALLLLQAWRSGRPKKA